MSESLKKIDATLTFADGQTVNVTLSPEGDGAWGNVPEVLWRSVPIREAICNVMNDEELWEEDEEW